MGHRVRSGMRGAGAGARVVGVDDASDYPAAAQQIPPLGEAAALDMEGLLRLAPSLVIIWETGTPPRVRAELERLHLPVLVTERRKLDDIGQVLVERGGRGSKSSIRCGTGRCTRCRANTSSTR